MDGRRAAPGPFPEAASRHLHGWRAHVRPAESTFGIMRNRTIGALGAAALMFPAMLAAQQQAAATQQVHTVKQGETLWGLAQAYLSDPHRWPEIYRLNREKIANPHWIYPGEELKLPGALARVTVSVKPAPAAEPPHEEPQRFDAPTVFRRETAIQGGESVSTEQAPAHPTVRKGEFVAAPFVIAAGGPADAGEVLKDADLSPIPPSPRTPIFKQYDRVLVRLPKGEAGAAGQRFLVVSLGPNIEGMGQVVVPTGVVKLTHVPNGNEAGRADIVQLFGEMNPGQRLLALDTTGISSMAQPAPVKDGREATVKWVQGDPVIPTVQSYVVLNLTSADGVKPGDQYLVFKPRTRHAEGGPDDPEVAIGRAQVVRVTPFGATAIVVSQQQAKIEAGAMVRNIAKMP
jgi:LysM repeat protein